MMYSLVAYGYSLIQILIITRKYFYVLYTYPIMYIFTMDDDIFEFIKGIYCLTLRNILRQTGGRMAV